MYTAIHIAIFHLTITRKITFINNNTNNHTSFSLEEKLRKGLTSDTKSVIIKKFCTTEWNMVQKAG